MVNILNKLKAFIAWYNWAVFSDSKSYRKKKGGTWYLCYDPKGTTGFDLDYQWLQEVPEGFIVEKTEKY